MATNMKTMKCIAAMDLKRGIGKNNDLPWRLKKEMKYFERMSSTVKFPGKRNAAIMGRRTWESIPEKYRPLSNRLNVLLSRTLSSNNVPDGVLVVPTLTDALNLISSMDDVEDIFICGGQSVYEEAIKSSHCDRIYLTHVHEDFGCDTFFPQFDEVTFQKTSDPDVPDEMQEENGIKYQFCVYQRQNVQQ